VQDDEGPETWLARREVIKAKGINGNGMGMPLTIAVKLLPTPAAADGSGGRVDAELGGTRESGAKRAITLATAVRHKLLPTPTATDSKASGGAEGSANVTLTDATVRGRGADWGEYEPAIRRWEQVTGQQAPPATEPTAKGTRRLSPYFTEWMMGLPAGWVTGTEGLNRRDQLKACGNGVVPQQALAALLDMLAENALEERDAA
jgi:DNA (cytosine-5)-methyltransferase 1